MLSTGQRGNAGIRRTWHFTCREENINPFKPMRLPLLFALDSKFNIPNGFIYVPDCSGFRRQNDGDAAAYCGADLASASAGCGGDSSDGGLDIDCSSDGGGDSGGGSDGCGGGGCGGGGD